ncbi:hypothetical protein K7X08_011389 [Anisodus acutangulus]|uniref:Uncharacterized protein n=1 Tax=Anisodus acutangulus TaxID=402998 RepID=A0A9Q1RIH4_9SOLA|nr:hypothetical protein K7X08_011389 [Anisodus acutangulus]
MVKRGKGGAGIMDGCYIIPTVRELEQDCMKTILEYDDEAPTPVVEVEKVDVPRQTTDVAMPTAQVDKPVDVPVPTIEVDKAKDVSTQVDENDVSTGEAEKAIYEHAKVVDNAVSRVKSTLCLTLKKL